MSREIRKRDDGMRPAPRAKRCASTGKRKFKTRDKALADGHRFAPEGLVDMHVYQCRHCRKWHVCTKPAHLYASARADREQVA